MTLSDERYTPHDLITRVRQTLGGIDLDPMSCVQANRIVKARRYFTLLDDGLNRTWRAQSVYLNPPGSLRLQAHRKFVESFQAGLFPRGCVVLYDWDHSTRWWQALATQDPAWALLRRRMKFSDPGGRMVDVGRSQALAFVGIDPERVRAHFADIARIFVPG